MMKLNVIITLVALLSVANVIPILLRSVNVSTHVCPQPFNANLSPPHVKFFNPILGNYLASTFVEDVLCFIDIGVLNFD